MQRAVTHLWTAWLSLFFIMVMTTACSPAATMGARSATTVVPVTRSAPTPTVSTAATLTPVPQTLRPVMPSGTITLTLWIADDIAPGPTAAGRVLRNQLDAFTAANPTILVDVVPKKASGKGGLLDFLLTTRNILPARLPDLVALDLSQVPLAAQAGILQPLDGIVPTDLSGDFFAFAAQAARYRNQWVAVPFAANVDHLVYNRTLLRKAPQTWDDLTKQKASILLPLGGDNAFLLQYFSLGATVIDASNEPALDVTATAQVLSWFKRAHDLGLVPETAVNLKTGDEVWTNFASGQIAMAQVSASRFVAERNKFPSVFYAPMPTREGKVTTLATGWAFALVTKEPTRQAATARFVQWMVQGERIAPWLRAARLVPTTRATVPLAVDPPDYAAFMREELEGAVPMPPAAWYVRQSEAWRSAMIAVWNGQTTPEEAARNAAGAK